MKNTSVLSPMVATKWYFACLVYYVLLLPFQVKTPPITLGIIIFGLGWLLSMRFSVKLKLLTTNTAALLSMAYMLWVFIAAAYAPVPQEAWKDAFAKIPFLVWPLLLGSLPTLPKRLFTRLIQFFIAALIMALTLALILAVSRYQESGEIKEFFFSRFLTWTLITPHYLGMYLNFAYGLLLFYALRQNFIFPRWLHFTLIAVLAIGIWLMAVRIQYVIFTISTIYLLFYSVRHKKGVFFAMFTSAAVVSALVIAALSFKPSQSRLIDTYNEIVSFDKKTNNKQTNPRKFLWTAAAQVIGTRPLIGNGLATGSDSIQTRLAAIPDAYFWDGNTHYHISTRHYNLHNAYLQHWAEMGLPGFLLLVAFFVVPRFLPAPTFKKEAHIFLLVAGISFATESILERQAGILYFSFFYALLFAVRWSGQAGAEPLKKATTHSPK